MPRYEFHCPECSTTYDARVPVGTTESDCECCGSIAKKQFIPTASIFSYKEWCNGSGGDSRLEKSELPGNRIYPGFSK